MARCGSPVRSRCSPLVLVLPVIFTPTGPLRPAQRRRHRRGRDRQPDPARSASSRSAGIWPSLDFRVDPHLNTLVRISSAASASSLAAGAIATALRWTSAEGIPLAGYVGGGAVGAAGDHPYRLGLGRRQGAGDALSGQCCAAALIGVVIVSASAPASASRPRVAGSSSSASSSGAPSSPTRGPGSHPVPTTPSWKKIGEELRRRGSGAEHRGLRLRSPPLSRATSTPKAPATVAAVWSCFVERRADPEDGEYVDLDEIRPDSSTPTTCWYSAAVPPPVARPRNSRSPTAATTTTSGSEREAPGTLVEHLPLGTELDAGAIPRCSRGRRPGGESRRRGAASSPPGSARRSRSSSTRPNSRRMDGADALHLLAERAAAPRRRNLGSRRRVRSSGSVGDVFGGVDLSIDGEQVASERGVLNNDGGLEQLGDRADLGGRSSARSRVYGGEPLSRAAPSTPTRSARSSCGIPRGATSA